MFFVYLGVYILILLIIWGFYAVARIHAFKFKNFSNHITKVSNTLFIFLVVLSVLGFLLVFQLSNYTPSVTTQEPSTPDVYY